MKKTGRNDPCPCGSGKKYKVCCLGKDIASTPIPSSSVATLEKKQAGGASYQNVIACHAGDNKATPKLIENDNDPHFYYSLGNDLQAQGKLDAAIISYRKALSLKPDHTEAYNNLGLALQTQGKLDDATDCYRQALALNPNDAVASYNLGNALLAQGNHEAAIELYRQTVRLDPQNESAAHLIAALTAQDSERPPSQYIEKLFDNYASTFDSHLVQNLEYKMPSELVALLKQFVDFSAAQWDVLDLGCGTGLSGLEIAPHARRLVGVDLSTKMLARARARNIYNRLEHSDLLPMMRSEKTSSYDVIIAADVFVYLGMLDEIISEAKRLLRSGGFFLFSVEALEALGSDVSSMEKPDYKLNPSGRYAHSASYLEKLTLANGFSSLGMISIPVRHERGVPITAWAAVWKS